MASCLMAELHSVDRGAAKVHCSKRHTNTLVWPFAFCVTWFSKNTNSKLNYSFSVKSFSYFGPNLWIERHKYTCGCDLPPKECMGLKFNLFFLLKKKMQVSYQGTYIIKVFWQIGAYPTMSWVLDFVVNYPQCIQVENFDYCSFSL